MDDQLVSLISKLAGGTLKPATSIEITRALKRTGAHLGLSGDIDDAAALQATPFDHGAAILR
ncbi:hypothetical protein N5O88_08040 [Pseudomonas sp. GD03721]|uniref:hypothetical protein n=1 Tax=Pseudomonadaceae TaxID=135621 RepID=UPI0024422FCA|nr:MULTISPECIES: hypothetical protein [Pseudomonas]MDG9758738.1 hypothetical protein [Pseudomonas sediminis]MDH1441819.1 hypothetical protein [Pseudomonas sp. GD03722]WGG03157.1 hypothetical protein N5O88_08040 [Pseudomonas sp. GD03721]WGG07324.1 hypothetical protein N5O87_08050 [Pseudomonas sp. GD03919]